MDVIYYLVGHALIAEWYNVLVSKSCRRGLQITLDMLYTTWQGLAIIAEWSNVLLQSLSTACMTKRVANDLGLDGAFPM